MNTPLIPSFLEQDINNINEKITEEENILHTETFSEECDA